MTAPRLNPNLLSLSPYVAGKSVDEVKQELGLAEIIKLASNESPIGPSPRAIEAARAILDQAHRYPGGLGLALRRTLAHRLGSGLDEHNFMLGNGGTDILRLITQAFVFDGGNTVMSRATFPMYKIFTTMFNGEPRIIAPCPDYRQNLDAMAAAIDADTRLVFLCSPNNPTGHSITQREAERFMARLPPHVVAVFDESYYEYVNDPDYADSLAFLRQGQSVLIVRSFSKAGGLANMRIGYMIGSPELAQYVSRAKAPFHTGDISLAAALASLDDADFIARQTQAVQTGRRFLYDALTGLGLRCLPSQANFVTFYDPPLPPETLTAALLRRGFIVRAMTGFGMPNAVRVSVGSPHENAAFVAALTAVLAAEPTLPEAKT